MTKRPAHLGLLSRAFSPTRAVAFRLAEDPHNSGMAQDREFVARRLFQLQTFDEKLGRFVRLELEAHGDPVP